MLMLRENARQDRNERNGPELTKQPARQLTFGPHPMNELRNPPGTYFLGRPSIFSNRSFASLILLARYGAPPRSGWLTDMIWR